MKLCIPIATDRGLQSPIFTCFGAAPAFLVVDTESRSCHVMHRVAPGRGEEPASPLAALAGVPFDGAVVRAIAPRTLRSLHAADVLVYLARHATVAEAVAAWRAGTLRLVTPGADPWAARAGASFSGPADPADCPDAPRAPSP